MAQRFLNHPSLLSPGEARLEAPQQGVSGDYCVTPPHSDNAFSSDVGPAAAQGGDFQRGDEGADSAYSGVASLDAGGMDAGGLFFDFSNADNDGFDNDGFDDALLGGADNETFVWNIEEMDGDADAADEFDIQYGDISLGDGVMGGQMYAANNSIMITDASGTNIIQTIVLDDAAAQDVESIINNFKSMLG